MKILADENIPFAREAFSTVGEVTLAHGRNLPPPDDYDAMIVRSVTKVNESILDGSNIQFVGTATIGTDHIDIDYLKAHNIGFASAPGSNATSVADYITAALLTYAGEKDITLDGRSIAVIGVGNVGSRVVKKCKALGMKVLKNDPPLRDASGDQSFLPLEDVLSADFVTVHVPLTDGGKYPTRGMVDARFLGAMRGVFINSSRGKVVDENALMKALGNTVTDAILDVWATEPNVNRELADMVFGGTPHIAGYSYDGKVTGTQMMYDSLCGHFGVTPVWRMESVMPHGADIECNGDTDEDCLRHAVTQIYDISRDFRMFAEHLDEFDRLRKEYPKRREYHTASITSCSGSDSAKEKLRGIGFEVM